MRKGGIVDNVTNIVYNTTRGIYSIEDKLSIVTVLLFCIKSSSKDFAKLMYTKNHESFIQELNSKYEKFDVDFTINFQNKLIKDCFLKTIDEVRKVYDKDGFHKALFEGDKYAEAIVEITETRLDIVKFRKETKQLKLRL